MAEREDTGFVIGSSTSSAKREILCLSVLNGTPPMFGLVLMCSARVSMLRAKSRGESGQPCLVPCESPKGSKPPHSAIPWISERSSWPAPYL